MGSARVLLGAWPRGSELLGVFDGLRVGKRRASLVHTSDVTVVSQDLIIVGLVIGMDSSSSSVLSVLATKAEGVCPHIVIQDAGRVRIRRGRVCTPIFQATQPVLVVDRVLIEW